MAAVSCRAIVERIDSLAYNVRGFRLRLLEPSALEFKAGQFIIVHVPTDRTVVKRAYSIASPPHERGILELCVQHVERGAASTYFWKLKERDAVSISGPHGNFVLDEPLDSDPVFMATGTGVAPLRAMIKHLFAIGLTREAWLLFGSRYEHALLYESDFRTLASLRRNFRYVPTVSRPKEWRGEVGYIQQAFQKYVPDFSNKTIYLSGWLEIVKAVNRDLLALGVPNERIHCEEWT